jgi:hypothetical protein
MPVDSTIVLQFGDSVSDDSFVVIELDEKLNRDSMGEVITTFLPGETAYFYVHYNPDELRIGSVVWSSGSVVYQGKVFRNKKEQIVIESTDSEIQLTYLPYDTPRWVKWYGNVGSGIFDGRDLKDLAGQLPAIGDVEYQIQADSYALSAPRGLILNEDETYPIVCVITMEEV